MFAFDPLLPVNVLFVLFIILCLGAALVGLRETQGEDPADHELPAAFRTVSDSTTYIPGRAMPENGAGGDGATAKQPRRPRAQ